MTLRYGRFPDGLCLLCKHYGYNADRDTGFVCNAFPNGIPREIHRGRFDHRQPHPLDNGLRFELGDGYNIPDWLEKHYEQERLCEEQARREEELETIGAEDDDESAICPDYRLLP